ncbi:MAG: late competence development ComFB family protein [Leptospiraceae bacterium]|nr:late competence development ComFB family protein [Leptospiraceae bacterium]
MSSKIIRINDWTKSIHNVVEDMLRVELKKVILENPNWGWEQISLQDVFGCAINQLPPIYKHKEKETSLTIDRGEIINAIYLAMEKVKRNPLGEIKEEK